MDSHVWLKHPKSGGYFHCPVGAVEHMAELGWEPSEPPPEEVNPAVAEQLAWRRELAAQAKSKPPKTATRGNSEEE